MVAVAVAVIIVVRRSGGPGEPVEPSLSGSRVYRAHPETAPSGKTLVALPISLVHSFVELNGKHTDTGIEYRVRVRVSSICKLGCERTDRN